MWNNSRTIAISFILTSLILIAIYAYQISQGIDNIEATTGITIITSILNLIFIAIYVTQIDKRPILCIIMGAISVVILLFLNITIYNLRFNYLI